MNGSVNYLDLIPGFCQGLTRVSISYPFDVVKVNMQTLKYKTTIDAFKNIYKTDPLRFYRGSSLCYLTVSSERSVSFFLAEKYNTKSNNTFLNGFFISLLTSIYNIPIQYITSNLANNNNIRNLGTFLKDLYANKTNVYKGYFIEMPKTVLGSTMFSGTYFYLRNNIEDSKYKPLLLGSISGIVSWIFTFPIDSIRTNIQTSNLKLKEIIQQRIKNYGYLSFYRGITPVIIRTIPSAALGMQVYELSREYIHSIKKTKIN